MSLVTVAALIPGCAGADRGVIREQRRYDKDGRLVSQTAPDNSETTFRYNDRGLLAEVVHPSGRISYGYDANGNRAWMSDPTGLTQYYYDEFDRLSAVASRHSPWRLTLYDYNDWGDLTRLRVYDLDLLLLQERYEQWLNDLVRQTSDRIREQQELSFDRMAQQLRSEPPELVRQWCVYDVGYQYDAIGRLSALKTVAGTITFSHMPDQGMMVRQLPNGIKSVFSYTPDGLLQSLRHEGLAGPLAEYRYEHDVAGNVTAVHELVRAQVRTTLFEWDARGYLSRLVTPDGSVQRYEYDAMGNRTRMQDATGWHENTFDEHGRLVQVGVSSYSWDANGYLALQARGQDRLRFAYDGRGLLERANGPGFAVAYRWDGDGNLVSRKAGDGSVHFLPNPLAPPGFTLAEFNDAGRLTAGYLYGDGLLGQFDASGRVEFYLEDGFNSIRITADPAARVIGQRDFTPFAEPLDAQGEVCGFRMAGERYLPETGRYLINGRLYDPVAARFESPNPAVGYPERFDSYNRYAHGCNAPGAFSGPRCNQTHGAGAGRGSAAAVAAQAVVVGGVNSTVRDMRRDLAGTPWEKAGIVATTTSMPLLPWGCDRFVVDLGRAAANYLTGDPGPTADRVMRELESFYGDRSILIGHSNGALTLYHMRDRIAKAVRDGKLSVKLVFLVGISPTIAADLQAFFNESGANITVFGLANGADLVGQGTAPGRHLGLSSPFKGALAAGGAKTRAIGGFLWSALRFDISGVTTSHSLVGYLQDVADRLAPGQRRQQLDGEGERPRPRLPVVGDRRRRQDDYPPFPPDDGGGGGGAAVGFGDPFVPVERELGGIELAAKGELLGDLGQVTGAVYDEATGRLVLIGDRQFAGPSMKPEDLAVALALVYSDTPQDPQFSLDPADPTDPRGDWLKAVYIPEGLGGTHFGKVMYEADWLLKQYSFGVRVEDDGRVVRQASSVPGVKSVADLTFENPSAGDDESWARFWIVSDEMKMRQSGTAVLFDVAKMRVRAKKIVPDPSSPQGFRDVEADEPTASEFARLFTEHYDELAGESPELERVRELAKSVALAKWMKETGVPVDRQWIEQHTNSRVETVGRVTALSVPHERTSERRYLRGNDSVFETSTRTLHLFGGVDLHVSPSYERGDKSVDDLRRAVAAQMARPDAGPVFAAELAERQMQATVIPLTTAGRQMWDRAPATEVDGDIYQFDDRRRVSKRLMRDGGVTEYTYDDAGKLVLVTTNGTAGWQVEGRRGGQGSDWKLQSPRGNTYQYSYGAAGNLERVRVNGRELARYEVDRANRAVTARFAAHTERSFYDAKGYLRRREVALATVAPGAATPSVAVDFNDRGSPVKVVGPELLPLTVSYAPDGLSPTGFSTPRMQVACSYDAAGHLTGLSTSTGTSAACEYDGEQMTRMTVSAGANLAQYELGEHGLVQSRDLLGCVTNYSYTQGRLSSVEIDGWGDAQYVHDDAGSLEETRFPDGSRTAFTRDVGGAGTTITVKRYPRGGGGHSRSGSRSALGRAQSRWFVKPEEPQATR